MIEELEKLYQSLQKKIDDRNALYDLNRNRPDYFKDQEIILENMKLMAKNGEDLDVMIELNRIIHNAVQTNRMNITDKERRTI